MAPCPKEEESMTTPAFASANIGIIRKLTQGCSAVSRCPRGESGPVKALMSPLAVLAGMVMASMTPAIVAWIPDLKTKIKRAAPRSR